MLEGGAPCWLSVLLEWLLSGVRSAADCEFSSSAVATRPRSSLANRLLVYGISTEVQSWNRDRA